MSPIKTAREVFRRYETDGVPGSGPNEPNKLEIQAWGIWLESLPNGSAGLAYGSLALISADLAHAANSLAIVYADATAANNGQYQKNGGSGSGSWVRIGDLSNGLVRLTVTGGTANAIVASAPETPTVPGNKLFILTPGADNTAATTIAVNGVAAVDIKNALGSQLAANSLLNGLPVIMQWAVDHYQLVVSIPVDATGVLNDALDAAAAASASATAAASSASALGNQVHQYDTRALAIAATIPTGVQAVKVTRYATGYPLAYATYIPGAGYNEFTEAGGHKWHLDLSCGEVNPFWYGAKGDGANADYTPIDNANTDAKAAAVPLIFQPGHYMHASTLALGATGHHVKAVGKVILEHTGTGVGVSLDGGGAGSIFDASFGRGNPIIVTGNINTTNVLYERAYHHSHVEAIIGNGNSSTGCGYRNEYSVLSTHQIIHTNNSVFPPTTPPKNPVIIDKRGVGEASTASEYHLVMESHLTAVSLVAAQNCRFTGTSENGAAGGVYIGTGSGYNRFDGFFCEANVGIDFYFDHTKGNTLLNCTGASTTTTSVFMDGSHANIVQSGQFDTVQVLLNGLHNKFDSALVITSFTNGDTTTRRKSCYNGSLTFYGDLN